ncbi:Junctional adhesion molecule-like [Labeo rohita]|uniref:Junctional adhesion molecule-like n=1 Tax=Labeo rohita TaxID=84645 RepID=A0ABQ8LJU1_LABRO|nr:Junctional adhesion molecule-like [Labeo rohita]
MVGKRPENMLQSFILCGLWVWRIVGVFGVNSEEIKSVSVMKGDSVTLNTEVQKYLFMQWMFGSARIAEVNRLAQTSLTYDGPEGRFTNRLQLDQTGSLIITDTRTTDSGIYQLTVVDKETIYTSYNVTVYDVTDEVKLISVMEGHSVTLNSDVTEVQRYLFMQWMFGSSRIAEINRLAQTNSTYDGPDGRFRNRLKLDQTGSLTITNSRTTDSGLYQLSIVSRETRYVNFKVAVYEHIHCCGFAEAVIRLVVSALVGVAAIAMLIYDIRSTRSELNRTEETGYLYQTHGVKSDQQYEPSRRVSSRYIQM